MKKNALIRCSTHRYNYMEDHYEIISYSRKESFQVPVVVDNNVVTPTRREAAGRQEVIGHKPLSTIECHPMGTTPKKIEKAQLDGVRIGAVTTLPSSTCSELQQKNTSRYIPRDIPDLLKLATSWVSREMDSSIPLIVLYLKNDDESERYEIIIEISTSLHRYVGIIILRAAIII